MINGKNSNRLKFLVLLCLGLAIGQLGHAQTIDIVSQTNVSCFGGDNGAVEVILTGGTEPITYTWTGPDGFTATGNSIASLKAGAYTVHVVDDAPTPFDDNLNITITEPAAALAVVRKKPIFYVCAGGNPSTDYINITGGTGPYTVDPLTIPIADGNTVTVTDDNGCIATTPEAFDVKQDLSAPYFVIDEFPADVFIPIIDFHTAQNFDPFDEGYVVGLIPSSISGQVHDISNEINGFNLPRYRNYKVQLNVSQTENPADWDNADYIAIEVDLDGDGPGVYAEIWRNRSTWNPTPATEGFGEGDDQSGNSTLTSVVIPLDPLTTDFLVTLKVRLVVHLEAKPTEISYNIQSFRLVAERWFIDPIADTNEGRPTVGDNSGSIFIPTFTDVIDWKCPTNGNEEFVVTRTWTAKDDCNNKTADRNQIISVGTPPFFTEAIPSNMTIDYCKLLNVTAPQADDDCSDASNVVVSYRITETDGTPLAGGIGDGDIVDFTFPTDPDNPIDYFIDWIATDEASITYTEQQAIQVLPQIGATLGFAVDGNFDEIRDICVSTVTTTNDIVFTIEPIGGTGSFDESTSFRFDVLDVADNVVEADKIGVVAWVPANNWFTFTTHFDNVGDYKLNVEITDQNTTVTGGCSRTFTSGLFHVHNNISTGTITRE